MGCGSVCLHGVAALVLPPHAVSSSPLGSCDVLQGFACPDCEAGRGFFAIGWGALPGDGAGYVPGRNAHVMLPRNLSGMPIQVQTANHAQGSLNSTSPLLLKV